MSCAGPLGSSDAPTLVSLILLDASTLPELKRLEMATVDHCTSSF